MLTFSLNPNFKASSELKTNTSLLKVVPLNKLPYHTDSQLSLDDNYMFTKYGFHLSDYECDQFHTHFEIWKTFKKSDAPFCMIISENTSLKLSAGFHLKKLKETLTKDQNWDIYFPFEKSEVEDENKFEFGYLLGCYWGLHAYFVSRKGVDKLLNIETIQIPLDEEILTRSILGDLDVFCEEIDCFDFQENLSQKKARDLAIRDAIFGSKAWTTENKQRICNLMKMISDLAIQNKVDLILSDGSLLGQIRHGGIMPWDDDVDLAIDKSEYYNFSSLLTKETSLKHDIFHWGSDNTAYCKIWIDNGQSIPGYTHKFPFVDIWFFIETEDQIIFDTGTVFDKNIYYPLSDTIFEGIRFKLPIESKKCLDVLYKNWDTKIQVFPWSHQDEQNSVTPLSYDIEVDDAGRILAKI